MKADFGQRGGFSLIEVILAMVILAMIAIGVTKGLIMTRGMAETNIREMTANAVASGYIEQLKSMPYARIVSSVRDNAIPLPTVLSLGEPDPLYIGSWETKSIVIDEDMDTGKERRMPLHVMVELDDLESAGNGSILSISLFYAWEDAKTQQRRERALRTMRSYVPTF
jgi:prepilin-type N-terminal cleavage/methylation domain-containing protein